MIAIDEEGGDVTRLDARLGSPFPAHATLGALDDTATTTEIAEQLGGRLAELGITVNLAPCADVNSNPSSPIVGTRAFSADADVAARHVAAFVSGLRHSGVAACVKHFPGHGGTSLDSHLAAPSIDETMDELLAGALRPFTAAISVGVDCIMTGHLVVPSIDDRPASLSARWTNTLRSTLGFDGIIATDALDMAAVSGQYGTTNALPMTSVEALIAGADLVCLASELDEQPIRWTIAAVGAALQSGRLDRSQMRASRRRIEEMTGVHAATRASSRRTGTESASGSGLGLSAASRALRIEGNVSASPTGRIIECRPEANIAVGVTGWGLVDLVSDTEWFGERLSPDEQPNLADIAVSEPLVVVVRDAARDQWQRAVIDECAAARPDVIVVEMGWPGPISASVSRRISTFGASRASARAVLKVLTGADAHDEPNSERVNG